MGIASVPGTAGRARAGSVPGRRRWLSAVYQQHRGAVWLLAGTLLFAVMVGVAAGLVVSSTLSR
jgi:hypothetical protein